MFICYHFSEQRNIKTTTMTTKTTETTTQITVARPDTDSDFEMQAKVQFKRRAKKGSQTYTTVTHKHSATSVPKTSHNSSSDDFQESHARVVRPKTRLPGDRKETDRYKQKVQRCVYCPIVLNDDQYHTHMEQHKVLCNVCGKEFAHNKTLKIHMRNHKVVQQEEMVEGTSSSE